MNQYKHFRDEQDKPSMDALIASVSEDMLRVDNIIRNQMQSSVPLIPQIAEYLIGGGGKRLRPMLTLASAKLMNYDGESQFLMAAAIEYIHAATLLHDDIVDGSEMRRGKVAANLLFGNSAAVLVGDYLFSRAFELMVKGNNLRALALLSRSSAIIAEGEVDQLTARRTFDNNEKRYNEIINAKTAQLFAASCQVSAILAGADAATEAALEQFGRNLGMAFQLIDDIIDYSSSGEKMGKETGDDFRDGKVTLPVIIAMEAGGDRHKAFWHDALINGRNSDEEFREAIRLMEAVGAFDLAKDRARGYGSKALEALTHFAPSKLRSAMEAMVEFVIARLH